MKDFNNQTEFVFSNEFIGFTTIPNYIFQCKQLSFKAIGIYCSILQFQNSPNHKISIKGLMAIHSDKETSVTSGLNELLEAGFLTREQIREKGKIKGYLYTVYMKPINTVTVKSKNTVTIDNTGIEPKLDFPDTEKPDMENQVNKKENTLKKKITKKKNKDDDVKSSINQSFINQFYNLWISTTGKRIKLTPKQLMLLNKIIEQYGEESILKAIKKISDSDYLMANIKPSKFLDENTFSNIFNGEYDNHTTPAKAISNNITSKNHHFTTTYSHNWNLEELERIDRQHLEDKYM